MKLSILGEFGKFTLAGLTRTRFRIRLMKLNTLGECEE
jgi:hypothetical protein